MTEESSGTLYLVVGPSGAGKDTLIDRARATLASTHVFPLRHITRPAMPGDSEQHVPETLASFGAAHRAGTYALTWDAHGLSYGIPASITDDLAAGRNVVINVSREAIAAARALPARVRVILVTAPPGVRAQRLARRGRESAPSIAERLSRTVETGADMVIDNGGPLESAVAAFIAALRS